jgi:hypothetical protein
MDYGARFYSPVLGRFISPDSIVPKAEIPQGFSRYSYVINNPFRYKDPTGHFWQEALELAGKAILGAISGAVIGVLAEAGVQVVDSVRQGNKLVDAVNQLGTPLNEASLIGAGVGGGVTGAILGGTDGRGGIASLAISAVAGGQANAFATAYAEEQLTSSKSFNVDRVIDRAALHGFLSLPQIATDAGFGVIGGIVAERFDGAISRYLGNGSKEFVPEITSLNPITKKAEIDIVSVRNPKPLTFTQSVMIVAVKEVKDWAIETISRWVQK